MRGFRLAIDGPAGSGKSTVSKRVAQKLGWTHIDTGAMYRAVTLIALEKKVDLENSKSYSFLENTVIVYQNDSVTVNGRNVTGEIRSPLVTKSVSLVSSFPYVRKKLVEIQKRAASGNIVMDGRDIGTVVLPDANLKIFLAANIEERAKRRYLEAMRKGQIVPMSIIENDIRLRDQKDSSREESPLLVAKDALVIDTTYLTIDEVVEKIIALIKERKGDINYG